MKMVSPYPNYEFGCNKCYFRCIIFEKYQIPLFLGLGDDVSIIDDDVTGQVNGSTNMF